MKMVMHNSLHEGMGASIYACDNGEKRVKGMTSEGLTQNIIRRIRRGFHKCCCSELYTIQETAHAATATSKRTEGQTDRRRALK